MSKLEIFIEIEYIPPSSLTPLPFLPPSSSLTPSLPSLPPPFPPSLFSFPPQIPSSPSLLHKTPSSVHPYPPPSLPTKSHKPPQCPYTLYTATKLYNIFSIDFTCLDSAPHTQYMAYQKFPISDNCRRNATRDLISG